MRLELHNHDTEPISVPLHKDSIFNPVVGNTILWRGNEYLIVKIMHQLVYYGHRGGDFDTGYIAERVVVCELIVSQ